MRYKFLAVLGLFVCASLIGFFLGNVAPAYGQTTNPTPNPSISFLDNDPIIFTVNDSDTVLITTICNVADSDNLQAALLNFNFVGLTGNTVDTSQVFTYSDPTNQAPTTLGCRQITFRYNNLGFKPGDYKGFLVVRNQNEKTIMKPLTVTIPSIILFQDGITVQVTRPFWSVGFIGADIDNSIGLTLPGIFKTSTNSIIDNSDDNKLIGNISNGISHFDVQEKKYTYQTPLNQTDTIFIPVQLMGVTHAGVYSGTINIGGTTVKLSYRVADGVLYAILVIAIGIFFGYFINNLSSKLIASSGFDRRSENLTTKYDIAVKTFKENYIEASNKNQKLWAVYSFDENSVNDYKREIAAIREKNGVGSKTIDPANPAYKAIDDALTIAETDADYWGKITGFGMDLLNLQQAVIQLNAFLKEDGFNQILGTVQPHILDRATKIVSDSIEKKQITLRVGGAITTGKNAVNLTNLIGVWLEAAVVYLKLEAEVKNVEDLPPTGQDNLFYRIKAKLAVIKEFLWEVSSQAKWDDFKLGKQFQKLTFEIYYVKEERLGQGVKSILSYTKGIIPEDTKNAIAEIIKSKETYHARKTDSDKNFKNSLFKFGGFSFGLAGLTIPVPLRRFLVMKAPDFYKFITALLVVIIAVFVGLSQYYFDKPFGSFNDYVSLLVIGTGAQLSVKGLVDILAGIFYKATVPK